MGTKRIGEALASGWAVWRPGRTVQSDGHPLAALLVTARASSHPNKVRMGHPLAAWAIWKLLPANVSSTMIVTAGTSPGAFTARHKAFKEMAFEPGHRIGD